jgi:hypothetical protein
MNGTTLTYSVCSDFDECSLTQAAEQTMLVTNLPPLISFTCTQGAYQVDLWIFSDQETLHPTPLRMALLISIIFVQVSALRWVRI